MQAEFRFGKQTPDTVARRQNIMAAAWRREVELMDSAERDHERTHGLPDIKTYETPKDISLTAPYIEFMPPAYQPDTDEINR